MAEHFPDGVDLDIGTEIPGHFDRIAGVVALFGASAPLKALQHKFGFEPEKVILTVRQLLGKTIDENHDNRREQIATAREN
jgi:hypothetical protein